MKNRIYVIIVVFIATVGCVTLLVLKINGGTTIENQHSDREGATEPDGPTTVYASPESKHADALSKIQLTDEEVAAKPPDIDEYSWLSTVFFHRINVQEKNGDVRFYGKVIDQNGEPVAGAKIIANSSHYVESLKEQVAYGGGKVETMQIESISNADGMFFITGYRARNLRFESVSMPGYISSPTLPGGFTYSPAYSSQHLPDEANPVVFAVWKKSGDEPLMKNQWRKRVIPNGRSFSFDLLTPRVIDGESVNHLRIRIFADYDSNVGSNNYPWNIEIEAPGGGGVQETAQPYPYQAPENGYESRLRWSFPKEDGSWTRDLNRTIYIKGPGGEFYASAKIDIKVFHTNSASIVMETLLNPAGSRNLEFNAEKQINR